MQGCETQRSCPATAIPRDGRGSGRPEQHATAREECGDTGGITATQQAGLPAATPRSGDELDPYHHGTQIDRNADSQGTVVDLESSQQLSPNSLASSGGTPVEENNSRSRSH